MKFVLGYSSEDLKGGTDDPSWADIDQAISLVVSRSNQKIHFLVLERLDGPFGEVELSLWAEHGHCLVTGYHFVTEDEDETVPLHNLNWQQDDMKIETHRGSNHPMVDIGGNYWDATTVTTNLELVKEVFKEFYRTGIYPHPWMY